MSVERCSMCVLSVLFSMLFVVMLKPERCSLSFAFENLIVCLDCKLSLFSGMCKRIGVELGKMLLS